MSIPVALISLRAFIFNIFLEVMDLRSSWRSANNVKTSKFRKPKNRCRYCNRQEEDLKSLSESCGKLLENGIDDRMRI
jgi:hypothetical protein